MQTEKKKKKVAINNPYCPYIFTLRSRETLQPFISKECVHIYVYNGENKQ